MKSKSIIQKSLSDFKSPIFLGLSLVPFVVIVVLFGYGYFYLGGDILIHVQSSLDQGIVPFLDPQEHPWLTSILTFSLFKWLFTLFFYLIGIVAVIFLSVVVAGIVIGFFTPMIIKIIQQKHYPTFVLSKESFTLIQSIPYFIKIGIMFLLLGMIALPLMFIPALNVIAINIPFYYLFHNFLVLDVGSNIVGKEEFDAITKEAKALLRSSTFTLYGISLVPILGVFMQIFYVITLAHIFFQKASESRA